MRPRPVLQRAIADSTTGARRRAHRSVAIGPAGMIPRRRRLGRYGRLRARFQSLRLCSPEKRGHHAPDRASVGPSLQSVLRGGIACIWGLPVASRGPADKWMLSLEPFSSGNAEHRIEPRRLADASAYACRSRPACRCRVVHLLVLPHRQHDRGDATGQRELGQVRLDARLPASAGSPRAADASGSCVITVVAAPLKTAFSTRLSLAGQPSGLPHLRSRPLPVLVLAPSPTTIASRSTARSSSRTAVASETAAASPRSPPTAPSESDPFPAPSLACG